MNTQKFFVFENWFKGQTMTTNFDTEGLFMVGNMLNNFEMTSQGQPQNKLVPSLVPTTTNISNIINGYYELKPGGYIAVDSSFLIFEPLTENDILIDASKTVTLLRQCSLTDQDFKTISCAKSAKFTFK
jgi:hypothetical protein